MAADAWLWMLVLLVHPVWVHSLELSCTLQSRSMPGSLYKNGDVIIGGLFPVHTQAPEPNQIFTQRAAAGRCQSVELRSYRWLQTMIFTVEEINRDPALLPNLTLGYLAVDTCLSEGSTLNAALSLVTGKEQVVSGEECTRAPTVPVIIGDARSSASIVLADTLGVFQHADLLRCVDCICAGIRQLSWEVHCGCGGLCYPGLQLRTSTVHLCPKVLHYLTQTREEYKEEHDGQIGEQTVQKELYNYEAFILNTSQRAEIV